MVMNLSKWLPTTDFRFKTWQRFWNSVPNNANAMRNVEIYGETEDLYWQYLGNGKAQEYGPVEGNCVKHYCFPYNYNYNLMQKTIQGYIPYEFPVQIWIGTLDNRVTDKSGFYKIIYDTANQKHTLSAHGDNADVLWSLGFDEGVEPPPMAINYK